MQHGELGSHPPYRQAVEMLRQAGAVGLDRQDVEVAADVLYPGSSDLMALFDAATEIRKSRQSAVRLHADFASVRRFAERMICAGEFEAMATAAGGALPEACRRRLDAALADPARAQHYQATAADHYAHDIMESLAILTGLSGSSITLDLPPSSDIAALTALPFLRFLVEERTPHA